MTSKTSDSSAERNVAPRRFSGKAALITGASDRGIGGAIAERFAEEGASLALVSPEEPKRLLKRLARRGRWVKWINGDVTQTASVTQAIAITREEFGRLDVLVNNAGVEIGKPLADFAEESWRGLLAVNLEGAIRTTQAALPLLKERGGVIVNIASALALGGCAGYSIYSASKAGLVGLTQSLAWELAPQKIRVVALAPALVHTPMVHKHVEQLTEEAKRQIELCHPLGVGLPADVAAAAAFLASPEARWITGVVLPLGWTAGYPLPSAPLLVDDE